MRTVLRLETFRINSGHFMLEVWKPVPTNGVAAYVNAESRSEFFQTRSAASTSGNGPKSMVNDFLLKAAQNGRDLIKTAGNGEKLNDIAKCIHAQMKVPLIQGCRGLLYAYDADVTTAFSAVDDTDKLPGVENKAEMWAFCSGALPYLAAVDATAVCVYMSLTRYCLHESYMCLHVNTYVYII
jgi:hypothetical protein